MQIFATSTGVKDNEVIQFCQALRSGRTSDHRTRCKVAESSEGRSSVYRKNYKRKTDSGERAKVRIKNIITYHTYNNNKKNFLKKIKNNLTVIFSSLCHVMLQEYAS